MSNEHLSDFKRYGFSLTRILKEKENIIFKVMFQNNHSHSLHTSWHTYDKLSQSPLPAATLHFYPARLSNFCHFSDPIERRMLTVVQNVLTFKSWMIWNVKNFNDSFNQNILIKMKYSSVKMNLTKNLKFLNLNLNSSTVINMILR